MRKNFGAIVLVLIISVLFTLAQKTPSAGYIQFYKTAEAYYNAEAPTNITDSLALLNYNKAIEQLLAQKKSDSVLIDCYTKKGIILQLQNKDTAAIENFLKGAAVKLSNKTIQDSFCFKPLLFAGASYYSLNNLDSALYFFKQCDSIAAKYDGHITEVERLYNKLGVLCYQTGNYTQSTNYFTKAINSISGNTENAAISFYECKTNLGAGFFKLQDYDKAMSIYKSLLGNKNIPQQNILHNIGSIYLEKKLYKEALEYLAPLNYNSQVKSNDLAKIYLGLQKFDSAKYYLDNALQENTQLQGNKKNINNGLALRYYGDFWMQQNNIQNALLYYQQSVIQFVPGFNDKNIYKNPGNFLGLYSCFNLFDAITAKAKAFDALFKQTKDINNKIACLQTYQAAFELAQYAERFFDNDEARLFLKKNISQVYGNAVLAAIELYKTTGQKKYLETAFVLAEKSKATVLQVNRQQLEIAAQSPEFNNLITTEKNIKANIAKLSLEIAALNDTGLTAQKQKQITDYELKAAAVQQKLNENSNYQKLRYQLNDLQTEKLQKQLIAPGQALLSYFLVDSSLIHFIITKEKFEYFISAIDSSFKNELLKANLYLQQPDNYDKVNAPAILKKLYGQLMKPAEPFLHNIHKLLIIPHNELYYVPFDVLTDSNNSYLIERFAISYNYAAFFLQEKGQGNSTNKIAAFAPFANATELNGSYTALPASAQEVQATKGNLFIDTVATKNNFMQFAPQNNIIHLATHAFATGNTSAEPFIAFYPEKNIPPAQTQLYQTEIYNLNLNNVKLVILSACETGKGQLIQSEGIISLSRAFSYAGCKSIVTSLWKAEDNATAYICEKLYYYLQKGYDKDEALQKAKISYLSDPKINPAFKTPNFWANLILTGDASAVYSDKARYLYYLLALAGAVLLLYVIKRMFLKKAVTV